jgi:hypothetical protein
MSPLVFSKSLSSEFKYFDLRNAQFFGFSALNSSFDTQEKPAEEPQTYPETTEERLEVELPPSPTLINRNAQSLVYLGVILFFVGAIAAIGLVSRKVVFAIIFALMLGLAIAIVFLPL